MQQIKAVRFVLAVHDLEKSVEYYSKELGFTLLEKPPGWAFIGRESLVIMLGECKDSIDPKKLGDHSYFSYVNVENSNELFKEFSSKNVTIRKELKAESWGMKEFSIETIDGHRIMFGENC